MCHKHFCMCHSTPSYFTPYLFFVAKVLNFALRLSYNLFLLQNCCWIHFDSILFLFSRRAWSQIYWFPISIVPTVQVGISTEYLTTICVFQKSAIMVLWKRRNITLEFPLTIPWKWMVENQDAKPNENRCQSFIITNQLVRLQ